EALDDLLRGHQGVGNGIAHLYFLGVLDAGNDIAYVAGLDLAFRFEAQLEYAHFIGEVFLVGGDELDLVALADGAVPDAVVHDDAAEAVEYAVEDEGLKGRVVSAFGGGYAFDDGFEDSVHAQAGAAAGEQDIFGFAADQLNDLVLDFLDHGAVHVDLVDDGD